MTGKRTERGLALVVVLWGIAALSLIAGAMLYTAVNAARVGHNAWAQLQVQTAADSGVQAAILSLFDQTATRPRLDGSARDIAFADIAVRIAIQDETGRIDLNAAGRNQLRRYFAIAGAADPDALADRVVDWRSPKGTTSLNGADDDEKAGIQPRRAPFQSVDELNLVPGMTPELFERLAPGLTVYSHSADFNIATAPQAVLETIPGIDAQRAAATIAHRPAASAQPGHAFAIVATASRQRMQFTRRAVILLTGDAARPYWTLDWR
jgi:general secretion pathway protein K